MAEPPILMPLWPRAGASETLEWLTSVIISEDGHEDRTEVRVAPRQTFGYRYFVPLADHRRIRNIIYGATGLQWYVPVWPQVQSIGAVADAATSLTAETRWSEFREGGFAMLWDSADHCQIVEIDQIADVDTLTLTTATEEFADAWLMPVRLGHLTGNPSRQFNGRADVVELEFEVDDPDELTPAAPTQYLGNDIYFDPGLLEGGSITERMTARIDVFDESLGQIAYFAPWDFNKPQRIHRMGSKNAEETWAIREFLHRRRGRSVAFWQPTFEADLRLLNTGNLTNSIRIADDSYLGYAEDRTHIAFETATGWLARAITAVLDLGGGEVQLTVSPSLGGIASSTVRRICYLGLKRLDTDRVEISHQGGTAFSCAVNTIEIQP
jgi:hypothetical protein